MTELKWRSLPNDVIELRLPLKPEHLPILRATTGVVAGVVPLNYDEITQLRAAVSKIFDLAMKHVTPGSATSEVNELAVRFSIQPDKIEILITGPKDYTSSLNSEEKEEGLWLLKSLIDELEFGAEVAGKTVVRMVKYKNISGRNVTVTSLDLRLERLI